MAPYITAVEPCSALLPDAYACDYDLTDFYLFLSDYPPGECDGTGSARHVILPTVCAMPIVEGIFSRLQANKAEIDNILDSQWCGELGGAGPQCHFPST